MFEKKKVNENEAGVGPFKKRKGERDADVSRRSLSALWKIIKISKVLRHNVNKKVWRDGYKYPQNSIPPFFHYILIVKCQFLSVNFSNTKYRIRVKFFFVRRGLGSQGKISRCVLLVCSYLQVEEKCGRLITSVYKIVRSFVRWRIRW